MPDSLRPSLTVEQIFVTQNPVVLPSPLDIAVFGIQRQMEWQTSAGDFIGGQVNPAYDFPNLNPGAVVERPTATDPVLRPHVYVQNRFGVAEVVPTYNWAIDPPQFTLAASLSAVFEISKGTTGTFSAISGKFIDANADFIEDEVAASDTIKIDGIASFQVTAIVSDDELNVARLDKGPGTFSGDLSIEDVNLDRTLTDLAFDFSAVVKIGDIVTVTGWDVLCRADGIDYSKETLGARIMTGPTQDFLAAAIQGPVIVPPASIDIVWIQDSGFDWVPAFYVTGNLIATTTAEVRNLITTPRWPASAAFEANKIFEIYRYTQIDLGTGIAIPPPVDYDDTTGGYTVPIAGVRTFSHTQLAAVIDFTAMLPALPPPLSRYSIAMADSFGAKRPIFKFAAAPAPTQTTVQVEDWDPGRPGAGASSPNVLTWELWDDAATRLAHFTGANITVENTGDLNKRTLTTTYVNFVVAGVGIGDIVYGDTGTALFLVTDVDGINTLRCLNIVPGSPPALWSNSEFGFSIADLTSAQLKVTRVVNENTIGVRNVLAGTPPATAFTDLLYAITVGDALDDLNYTIEKTLTGSPLEGTVLSTYTARRNDHLDAPFEVSASTRESLLGFAVPANPLGFGAWLALSNTPYTIWCIQVEEDTVTAWQAAIEMAKISRLYVLTPLTQDETVLGYFRTHVDQQSAPDIKRERILFQDHKFERIETRTAMQGGDAATYTKNPTTTTITVARDLEAYGVVVGDVFEGLDPVFEARIITIVSGVTTTMTVVNANGLPIGGPTAIVDWYIRSKDLTDSQFADKIAAYPGAIKDRRIRNVYPDTVEVKFTDGTDPAGTSGFYGGGDVIEEVGGEYLSTIFAAARSGQKPGQPLSRFNCTGIHKLLNPFGDPEGGNEDLNDKIINGGNWVASQSADDAAVFAIRALTTDVSTVFYLEDHVTVQVDNFARLLRNQIRPLLGPFNISDSFFDIISTNQEAVRTKVIDDKDARKIEFLGIFEIPELPDTFGMDYDFTPFVTGAKGRVRIFI